MTIKTEKEIVAKMEKMVDQFTKNVEELGKEGYSETNPPPLEKAAAISAGLAGIATLGWVMGCEEEVNQMFSGIKLAHSALKLNKMGM